MIKEVLQVGQDDVFLDIGHGIGNTCIQASFTTGCESRGIEVVSERHQIAEVLRDMMIAQNRLVDHPRIVLRHGRLEDPLEREFLIEGVTKAYCNNFNGVFAERAAKSNQNHFLDDYIAALFAMMAPGSSLVTLHPLSLGPSREDANRSRRRIGLTESDNASFYNVTKVLLGKACDTVTWSQNSGNRHDIYVYKYDRLLQPAGKEAVFMCGNKDCEKAINDEMIPAVTPVMVDGEERYVMNHCGCRVTTKTLRKRKERLYPL